MYSNNLNPYKSGAGSYQSEDWDTAWTYSDDKPAELVDKVIKKIRETTSMPAGTAPDRGKTAVFLAKRHTTIDERHVSLRKRHATIDERHVSLRKRHATIDERHATIDEKHIYKRKRFEITGMKS